MIEVKLVEYADLTDEELEYVPDNGCGKLEVYYLKVTHGGRVIALESDAMEPEDATFTRDLVWIKSLLLKCYEIGKKDA